LTDAGGRARGATLYVTLEPCCHFGRTAPCTDAIIRAGVARVVGSVEDANPLVKGKGFRLLRQSGIDVHTGVLCREATRLNEDFFFWITHGRPWVSVKLGMTLDGRIADFAGDSQWITSVDSRRYAHELRRTHAAVGVGRATLERDNPRLTVRHGKAGNPARFVFSTKASVPSGSYFVTNAGKTSRSILVVHDGKPCSKGALPSGLEIWRTGTRDANEGLLAFLRMACEDEITSILIEGGGKLASSFVENRLANRLYLLYGNKILGGGTAGLTFTRPLYLAKSVSLDNMETTQFGRNIMVTGVPVWR
jgi:diaminohydroxyphosphoribosylaminopyrimidine deaminase/5-amino-6-(5-phosphoribosylamino)uracil reductase